MHSREHLFKECMAWKQEIRLWRKVGEASLSKDGAGKTADRLYKGGKGFAFGVTGAAGPGNTSVKKLLSDSRFVGAVLDFLKSTGAGKLKSGVL